MPLSSTHQNGRRAACMQASHNPSSSGAGPLLEGPPTKLAGTLPRQSSSGAGTSSRGAGPSSSGTTPSKRGVSIICECDTSFGCIFFYTCVALCVWKGLQSQQRY